MRRIYIKLIVLLIVSSLLKIGLVEGSFAINFINFSYHKSKIIEMNPFLTLLIYFLFHIGFYALVMVINHFLQISDSKVLFVYSCIVTLFELLTYNLNNKTVDIVSGFDLLLINVIVLFFIIISQTHYYDELFEECKINS